MADSKTVLEFVKQNAIKMLDLRFTDLPGLQHHVSYPIHQLTEASFEESFGMDGSSIRGWAAIHESDMLLIPDPSTHLLDPFTEVPTLWMRTNAMFRSVGAELCNGLGAPLNGKMVTGQGHQMPWPARRER